MARFDCTNLQALHAVVTMTIHTLPTALAAASAHEKPPSSTVQGLRACAMAIATAAARSLAHRLTDS